MLSETLETGLREYRIGEAIRNLRTEKGLGLEQLGRHTGLSAGLLSRIERSQIFPTLPTLMRIAMVFGVGLEHFFDAAREQPILEVVRGADRLRLPNTSAGKPQYHFESLSFPVPNSPIEAYLAEFSSGRAADPHAHPGLELLFVTQGRLRLGFESGSHDLNRGDSIYFDAQLDHSYECLGSDSASAMVVITASSGEA